jgi:hypothetical protein
MLYYIGATPLVKQIIAIQEEIEKSAALAYKRQTIVPACPLARPIL